MAHRRSSAFIGAFMCMTCAAAAGAQATVVSWECSSLTTSAAVPVPEAAFSAILNRFAALYSARVVGLLHSGDRVFLLTSGGIVSRTALRGEMTAGPSDREFIAQRHRFVRATGAAPGRDGAAIAKALVCLRETETPNTGVIQTRRGEVLLAAGKAVSLIDPADSGVSVELKAAADAAMDLGEIAVMSGRLGVYAGLMRQRGQLDATIAVQGPAGKIAFRALPEAAPVPASRGSVTLSVKDAAGDRESPAIGPVPAAISGLPGRESGGNAAVPPPLVTIEKPSPAIPPQPVTAAVEAPPVVEAARPDGNAISSIEPSRAAALQAATTGKSQSELSYQAALQTLMARQGSGRVRSVSELTRVHPAVDALRALLP